MIATFLLLILITGSLSTYEIIYPERDPVIKKPTSKKVLGLRYKRDITPFVYWSEKYALKSLHPSLEILDETCPEVSEWFRKKLKEGKVVWDQDRENYAKFNWFDRSLYISRILFVEDNAFKAAVIVHEYKHSLQSYNTWWRANLAVFILGTDHKWIAENDALRVENQYYLSLTEKE